jgi:HPt (histidine-containing phosphotransfer) domain-containing protein
MTERQLISPAEALMDRRVLRDFLELLGPAGPAVLRGIVEMYLKETPLVVEDLGEALACGEYGEAAGLAHRLKSSALNIGANSLAMRCAELEAACRAEHAPTAAAYASILAEFTSTRRAMKGLFKELC